MNSWGTPDWTAPRAYSILGDTELWLASVEFPHWSPEALSGDDSRGSCLSTSAPK